MKNLKIILPVLLILQSCATAKKLNTSNWVVASINDASINRSVSLPTLQIDIESNTFSGFTGCNNYTAKITKITQKKIGLGTLAVTEKACFNKNIESTYLQALHTIKTYSVDENKLIFLNAEDKKVLSYIKKKEDMADKKLHNIWAVTKINGALIEKEKAPRVEINLTTQRVLGNDGCNSFFGTLKEVTDTKIVFGSLAATKKRCPDMTISNTFNKAMPQVAFYKLKGLQLTLLDVNQKEILHLLKVD